MDEQQSGFFRGFETKIAQSVVQENYEKSTMDKLTARDEVFSLRALMKKQKWDKSDIFEASYLLVSIESKLGYTDDWERLVVGKFFVWLREFLSVEEAIINYQEGVGEKISLESSQALEQCRVLMENVNKSGIDIYEYITRSSLSVGGKGFEALSTNRYEAIYPTQQGVDTNKKGILGGFFGKG